MPYVHMYLSPMPATTSKSSGRRSWTFVAYWSRLGKGGHWPIEGAKIWLVGAARVAVNALAYKIKAVCLMEKNS